MSASTSSMQPGTTRSGHTSAIRAKKVIGTTVKNTEGEKIGTIEDIALDKLSNNIMFTVCGFGGFLGMGEKYHPIPWGLLNYQESQDAYVVGVTADQLRGAPADTIEELMKGNGVEYRDRAYTYYKAPKYW
ncbi:MAG TPA: PRC-barrel domain-containing protein [Steroidobacteraceae bacterium]|jgi:sporulation protein YlmC with PRC-barrel domain